MPNVSLRDIQFAIDDSKDINTYNSSEEINECDVHSLLSEGGISCSELY